MAGANRLVIGKALCLVIAGAWRLAVARTC